MTIERGRIMKRTYLLAVLVSLTVIAIFAADASAYYHPTVGRFVSRDPGPNGDSAAPATGTRFVPRDPTGTGQYRDGTNLYQYVQSNPVAALDPSGLWKIERKSTEKRAVATAEKNDTIGTLAKKVRLDPAEFRSWLDIPTGNTIRTVHHGETVLHGWKDTKGLMLPGGNMRVNFEICPGEKVTVPNVALINWGDWNVGWTKYTSLAISQIGYNYIFLRRTEEMKNYFLRRKYHVIIYRHADKGLILDSLKEHSRNLAAWGFLGHGDGGFLVAEYGEYFGVTDVKAAINYKLSWIILYACESGAISAMKNSAGEDVRLWTIPLAKGGMLWASEHSFRALTTKIRTLRVYRK